MYVFFLCKFYFFTYFFTLYLILYYYLLRFGETNKMKQKKKKKKMKNIWTATEHWPSVTEYRHSVKSLNNFFCQVYYSFSPLGIKQLNVLNSQAGGGLLWVMRLNRMDHVEQFSKNNQRSENRKLNQIEKLMSKPLFFLVTSLCLLSSE